LCYKYCRALGAVALLCFGSTIIAGSIASFSKSYWVWLGSWTQRCGIQAQKTFKRSQQRWVWLSQIKSTSKRGWVWLPTQTHRSWIWMAARLNILRFGCAAIPKDIIISIINILNFIIINIKNFII
jgi:hypothetical protein